MINNSIQIEITQKPKWITYDEIADVLHDAHRATFEKGMRYSVLNQNGQDLRRRIGEDGVFFVALLNNKTLVGVTGVSFKNKSNAWYTQNKPYAEIKLVGVRSEYKGLGIYNRLQEEAYKYAFERVELLMTHTATQNTILLNNNIKRGWKFVDYLSWDSTNYYSIVMAKWRNECPYSDTYCRARFVFNKCKTKLMKTKNGEYTLVGRMIKKYIFRK